MLWMCPRSRLITKNLKKYKCCAVLGGIFMFIYMHQDFAIQVNIFKVTTEKYMKNSSLVVMTTASITQPKLIDGYEIANRAWEFCENHVIGENPGKITVRFTQNKKALYCPIYKVGTTFWRRVFMIENDPRYVSMSNPYKISFDKEYKSDKVDIRATDVYEFKFMFTRDPYVRLFSMYVDKLLAPNPYFWKTIGEKIVRFIRPLAVKKPTRPCGHDVTFSEFIHYVIHSLETKTDVDPHFVPMEENCNSCQIKYDFIGKMESFPVDSLHILRELKLSRIADVMEVNGSALAADDAIRDTLSQPFAFKRAYLKYIPFHVGIQRSWTKLQLRGLTGPEVFNISQEEANKYTFDKLLEKAKESRAKSTKSQRKEYSEKKYKEYWKQIDKRSLDKLAQLYATDFRLFGYEKMPETIFGHL